MADRRPRARRVQSPSRPLTGLLFPVRRPARQFLLALVPLLLTVGFYAPVLWVDVGWLRISDDLALLGSAQQGVSLAALTAPHGNHFMPLTRLVYAGLEAVFGTTWTPYGALLVLGHGLTCSLWTLLAYRVTASAQLALAAGCALTLCVPLSSGVLIQFLNVSLYGVYAVLLACVLLALNDRIGSALALAALSLTVTTQAVMGLPAMVLTPLAQGRLRSSARLLLGASVIAIVYAIVLGLTDTVPGASEHGDPESLPALRRFLNTWAYGLVGWLLPSPRFDDAILAPQVVRDFSPRVVMVYASVALGLVALEWRRPSASSQTLALGVLCGLVAALGAAVLVMGIQYLQLWHMRYNGPVVLMGALSMSAFAAYTAARLPERYRAAAG